MICVTLIFLFFSQCLMLNVLGSVNDSPIIGILAQEVNDSFVPDANNGIVASNVKFLESAGARVVPIWIYKPREYYEDIMTKINGVLFPGGGDILKSSGYGRTGKIIFDIATEMNDRGDFFPLWGTCLGFELLNFLAVNKLWMKTCISKDLPTNIQFADGYKNSRIFENLDDELDTKMQEQDVVIHYHHWCLTPQNYTLSGLNKYFKILALNRDSKNMTFVSIVEAYKYPYYGVSFHPEKVMFEWPLSKTHHNIPHSLTAIRVSQYFANFFVNEAKKCSHHFPSKEAEDAVLIYNYNPVFIGKYKNVPLEQVYYLKD